MSRRLQVWSAASALAAGSLLVRTIARRARHLDLTGRAVLVTGGSRGLGLELAREFGARRARVAICARETAALERARADLSARGVETLAVAADVGDSGQVGALVRDVVERFGRLDVLVNNAGIIQVGPMETMTLSDYEEAMRSMFWAAVYTTRAALPHMRAQGGGRIVNIASIGAKISVPHLLPYSAAKFALAGFSEGLRAELARHRVHVVTVFPGLMRTGSPLHATFKGRHRAEYAWFAIADALPGLSMDASRAARRIVGACVTGEPHVVLSAPAKAAALARGLLPGLTIEALALANRLLPRPDGIGAGRATGLQSRLRWVPSFLTRLGDRAARRHNQVA